MKKTEIYKSVLSPCGCMLTHEQAMTVRGRLHASMVKHQNGGRKASNVGLKCDCGIFESTFYKGKPVTACKTCYQREYRRRTRGTKVPEAKRGKKP